MDNRKFNKGTIGNKGGGRKPKAEEERIVKLSTDAIIKVFGSEEKYWQHLAKESKDSFSHLRLLHEYTYGKPKERIEADITSSNNQSLIGQLMEIPESAYDEILKNDNTQNK
jgi:hypothetical protein